MPSIVVLYYTRQNHTKQLADAVAEGLRGVDGVDAKAQSISEVQPRDLLAFDGLIIGSPTYYGSMAAEVKKLFDDSISIHGQLAGKVGGAFSSSANVGGGNETTVLSILQAMLIHGMIVIGRAMGDHYGPVGVGENDDRAYKQCRRLGESVGQLAKRLQG